MIPAGYYQAKCTETQWCFSSKGTKSIACLFELFIDADVPEKNTTITWYGYFTDKTWERTCESLMHMGWSGDDLSELGELEQTVSLDVAEEEYEGRVRNKVQWVNPVGRKGISNSNPMSEQDIQQFAAQMKSRLGKLSVPKSNSGDSPVDDIPF